uniref:Cation efflux protein n=1 Tax=Steinernema glaseri TaxID=37863 RepID=A0A1I7Y7F1_9BILA
MAQTANEPKDSGHSHHEGHGHSHSHFSVSRGTKLLIMISMTFAFFVVEMVVGYASLSMSLIADSFHMLSDVMALAIGFVCLKIAERNTSKNTFGWVRAEVLGALVNGVFLLALCFSIFVESVTRLFEPHPIRDPKLVLIVGFVGLGINLIGLLMFHGHAHSHGPDPSSVRSELENNLRKGGDGIEGQNLIEQDKAIAELQQDFEAAEDTLITGPQKIKQESSGDAGHLNMRGVFLHVASDAIGSVIVIITAIIQIYAPDTYGWNKTRDYIDPCLRFV